MNKYIIEKDDRVFCVAFGGSEYRAVSVGPKGRSPTTALLGLSCAALVGAAVAGGVPQGGAATSSIVLHAEKAVSNSARSIASEVAKQRFSGPEPSSWASDIEWIKFESDVSISALASLFDVTRKTFYSWMSGEVTPRAHRVLRIAALRGALTSLSSREERTAVFGLLDKKLEAGPSIRQLIASNSEDDDVMEQLSNAFEELLPTIQKAAGRAGRVGSRSRAFEASFPAA